MLSTKYAQSVDRISTIPFYIDPKSPSMKSGTFKNMKENYGVLRRSKKKSRWQSAAAYRQVSVV
jgi:hypothetical protein